MKKFFIIIFLFAFHHLLSTSIDKNTKLYSFDENKIRIKYEVINYSEILIRVFYKHKDMSFIVNSKELFFLNKKKQYKICKEFNVFFNKYIPQNEEIEIFYDDFGYPLKLKKSNLDDFLYLNNYLNKSMFSFLKKKDYKNEIYLLCGSSKSKKKEAEEKLDKAISDAGIGALEIGMGIVAISRGHLSGGAASCAAGA